MISPIWNPRKITDREREKLQRSIDEYGYISPVIVNKVNNHIVGGNQRVKILKGLGYDLIDVIYINEPDLDREKALNLSLNKVNGEWDIDKLENLLVDLELNDVDLDLTGFDNLDFKELDFDFDSGIVDNISKGNDNPIIEEIIIEDEEEYDEEIPLRVPVKEDINLFDSIEYEDDTVTVYGEEEPIKDPTPVKEKGEQVNKGLGNTKGVDNDIIDDIDSISTNIQYGDLFKLGEHRLYCGDATNVEDLKVLMEDNVVDTVFTDPPYDSDNYDYSDVIDKYIDDANVFIMNSDVHTVEYLKKSKLNFVQFIIADFLFTLPRPNRPYLQHILVSHETKGNALHCRNLGKGLRSIIKMKYRGFIKDDIRVHKHQKSVDFVKSILEHYAENSVLDVFGGSGTTLIACEELGFKCFMMEIEPKFVQLIIDRYERVTGDKVIKLN